MKVVMNMFIKVGIAITILLLLACPVILVQMFKGTGDYNMAASNIPYIIALGIYILGIPYLIMIYKGSKIMNNLKDRELVKRELYIISKVAYLEVGLFLLMNIALYVLFGIYLYAVTIFLVVLAIFIFGGIGLFSKVILESI